MNSQPSKILLAGTRRSGKTSIRSVLFECISPKALFPTDPSTRLVKSTLDSVIPLEIWDYPGNLNLNELGVDLSTFQTMIFVIDIRDTYQAAVTKLAAFLTVAHTQNPTMQIEIFLHKAEKAQEDDRRDNQAQVESGLEDRLHPDFDMSQIGYHFTSVFDYSLHAEFSLVLQKMIGWLPELEHILDHFVAHSSSPKAFLFDIKSRVHVATDGSPVDPPALNLCNDYLAMLNAFGPLYRSIKPTSPRHHIDNPKTPPPTAVCSPIMSRSSSGMTEVDSPASSPPSTPTVVDIPTKQLFYPSAATSLSSTGPGMTLTYHLITPALALLAFIPTNFFESRRGLVEFNAVVFREAVQEMLEAWNGEV